MAHTVTIIPGPSTEHTPITTALLRVVSALGVDIDWQPAALDGATVSSALVDTIRKSGCALMPSVPIDRLHGDVPPIVQLRRQLGVFGNLRPVQSIAGLGSRHPDVDLVVVRETTEDIYANLEHESIEGVYESFKVTTEAACERIARYAFEFAKIKGRKKVTIVHKANIMKKSDGLFLRTGQKIATEYPDIEVEDMIVDALCMKLVLHPSRFDVLVCANLFGDIVADLCAGLVGGFSNSPSINVADGARVYTVGHCNPAEVAYSDKASTTSLFFASVLMLRDLGEHDAANRLMQATSNTLEKGIVPIALGGAATTVTFADAVISVL